MDDRYTPRPVARWYMPAAIASLLFMLLGCLSLFTHFTTDPAQLPLDQRAMMEAEPAWVVAASAIAILVGTVGALLLVLRRKAAEALLLVALIAVAVWVAGTLLSPLADMLGTDDIAILVVVALITWTIYWFARHSRQRNWLR